MSLRFAYSLVCLCVLAAPAGGCTRVPPESVGLAEAVGGRLDDLRQRHAALARGYLDLKREKFDAWFLDEYEPTFRRNYERAWEERRGAPPDPADEGVRRQYTRDVIAEYDVLASQIRESEQQFLSRLDAGYAGAAEANAAVAALLRSAVELSEARKGAWDRSVGRAAPGLRADALDRTLEEIQAKALRGLGDAPSRPDERSGLRPQ